MKKLLMLTPALIFALASCSTSSTPSETGFGGSTAGYYNSTSARNGHPMHWRKRKPLGTIFSSSQQAAPAADPALGELTAEDIENIKKLRKQG